MTTRDLITEKLRNAFAPESLRVEDESHRHEGHAGHRPGGETHFRLYIVSEAFRGKSRIERHRMINAALAGELAGGVHALAIHAAAPGEGAKSMIRKSGSRFSEEDHAPSKSMIRKKPAPDLIRGRSRFSEKTMLHPGSQSANRFNPNRPCSSASSIAQPPARLTRNGCGICELLAHSIEPERARNE